MIEVTIKHVESNMELGRITIENVSESDQEFADYSVRFGVDSYQVISLHQRSFYRFPRTRYNVFALVMRALNTLDHQDLLLHEFVQPKRTHKNIADILRWKM